MADWRQIQARIRKAKTGPEAVSKLSELFKRTRDAMVAWELGAIEEKADHKEEAGNWYTIAAQRFRRADWKKKAEEALTRLGVAVPAADAPSVSAVHEERLEPLPGAPLRESQEDETAADSAEEADGETESESAPDLTPSAVDAGTNQETGRRKRRRGRRGGRGRKRRAAAPGLPAQTFAEHPAAAQPQSQPQSAQAKVERRAFDRVETEPPTPEQLRPVSAEMPAPMLPSERMAHGRTEPGVASRMAHLESLLRRLLGSPLRRLEDVDEAPAGPGVFILSDTDQTSSYYVEACQTLRVGLGNLLRGGRGGRSGRGPGQGPSETSLKSKLAEHLEISEAKVSQYLKDHCVVRWIQLDDEAPMLAHFAVAVLRTPLNLN
jgi:hypothetical protein